jgi:SAM-dependent methyltransferase
MNITGSVLEVGAMPSDKSLLCMKSLDNAAEKVGINLMGSYEFKDFKIHQGNANSMDLFEDERFDVVLCNALIEHDKYFWKTIAEIKRVTKHGGIIVLGCPGYTYHKFEKFKWVLSKIPFIRNLRENQYLNMFFTATITLQIHNCPGDYYRFSPQAFTDVFFDDLDNVEVREIMLPTRILGFGTKKRNS